MFKISGSPIIAGTIIGALQTATGPPASALDRWIELTNNTRMPIVEIYIGYARSDRWNIDLLGDDYLAPASSVLVNIDDRAGCRFENCFRRWHRPDPPRCGRVRSREICDLLSIAQGPGLRLRSAGDELSFG